MISNYFAEIALGVALLGLAAFGFYIQPDRLTIIECVQSKTSIVAVGGCDRHGNCAVALENGRRGEAHLPVAGDIVYQTHRASEKVSRTCD